MLASFLIVFRESLEAALIIGIILAFLIKSKNTKYLNPVFMGIAAGALGSIAVALLFQSLAGGFTGRAEEIFEGVTMLAGALLLTSMILWMIKDKHIAHRLTSQVSQKVENKNKIGLFLLTTVSILREGVETVIFLGASSFVGTGHVLGSLLGFGLAVLLGYLMFVTSTKIDIKKFFMVSSIMLFFVAAGLIAHGVHELQEAALLPTLVEHVWDLNPAAPLAASGIYPLLHEKGTIGIMAVSLLGYNGNPSLLEVIVYLSYLTFAFIIFRRFTKASSSQLSNQQLHRHQDQ